MRTKFFVSMAALAMMLFAHATASAQFAAPGPPPGLMQPGGIMPGMPQMGVMPGMIAPAGFAPMMAPPPGFPTITHAAYNVGSDSCDSGKDGCDGKSCGECGKCDSCCCSCGGGYCHSFAIWGEFLYLRARDADVAYGVEVNAATAPPDIPIQVNRLGVVDPDWQPGFRTGVDWVLDECNKVTVQYTMWESGTSNQIGPVATGNSIQSLVAHPATLVANSSGVQASAQYDLSMDLIDADYRGLISYDCNHQLNYLIGIRYAQFEQGFAASTPINGNQTVVTDIDFEGAGLRLGLEGERTIRNGRWRLFGKLHGSIVPGEFKASFDQGTVFDNSVVDTDWEAGRVVSIVDLEVGVAWVSQCENWRVNLAYQLSGWYGMVKTDEWITAVHTNDFDKLRDQMTFDGLVARLEARF